MERLRRVVLDRLIRYYRYLVDLSAVQEVRTITSARIGAALDIDASQVRKDFAAVGLVGMSRIGYDACEVCRTIRQVVGFDRTYEAVLVGAGKLGVAILSHPDFERYGLRIVGAFDSDAFKVGRRINGHPILPVDDLPACVRERGVRMGILATPPHATQAMADFLVALGVRALWNFTPVRLTVPEGVVARNERLTTGLAEIAYHLSHLERLRREAEAGPDEDVETAADEAAVGAGNDLDTSSFDP